MFIFVNNIYLKQADENSKYSRNVIIQLKHKLSTLIQFNIFCIQTYKSSRELLYILSKAADR